MHYLDDYFTVDPPQFNIRATNIQTVVHVADKLEGLTTSLVFLGILIDTTRMETALPDQKLVELLSELQLWFSCKKWWKRELLSLIGKLNFACRIIPAGRIFLRRPINLSMTARFPHRQSYHNECRSSPGNRMVVNVPSYLEWPCYYTGSLLV